MGDAVLFVRMSDELKQRLDAYAKARELPTSAAARMLIIQALDREGDPQRDQEDS